LWVRGQAHCDEATADLDGRVVFSVRQLGGLTTARGRSTKRQQLWVDMRFPDFAPGHVRGDLYELQPPMQPGEVAPPRPHSPPEFGSDSQEEE
jgi:hypothetical protein